MEENREMTVESEAELTLPAEDLREPDRGVLRLLEAEGGTVAFQGLRRRMNVHQETLSRALKRLEEDGFVHRTERGYRLTDAGSSVAQRLLDSSPKVYVPVFQSFLPGDIGPGELASHLQGRWFNNLRWLGMKEDGEEAVLRWVTEGSGAEIVVRLRWGQAVVETDAAGQDELVEALIAAQRVFGHLTEPWRSGLDKVPSGVNLLEWSERARPAG